MQAVKTNFAGANAIVARRCEYKSRDFQVKLRLWVCSLQALKVTSADINTVGMVSQLINERSIVGAPIREG